jgi:hypothetical protein
MHLHLHVFILLLLPFLAGVALAAPDKGGHVLISLDAVVVASTEKVMENKQKPRTIVKAGGGSNVAAAVINSLIHLAQAYTNGTPPVIE